MKRKCPYNKIYPCVFTVGGSKYYRHYFSNSDTIILPVDSRNTTLMKNIEWSVVSRSPRWLVVVASDTQIAITASEMHDGSFVIKLKQDKTEDTIHVNISMGKCSSL